MSRALEEPGLRGYLVGSLVMLNAAAFEVPFAFITITV